MPPTSEHPRLANLDPRAIGREAARRVLDRVAVFAIRLSPGLAIEPFAWRAVEGAPARRSTALTDEDFDATDLAATAAALTLYAQRGCSEAAPVWDWTGDDMAGDAVRDLVETLATDALGTEGGLSEVLLGGDEPATDPLRLVLTAAWTRVQLASGEPVTPAQLGALAGLHPSRVRALRQSGEIPGWSGDGGGRGATPCPPKAARRWLASRGVAGF